ncbi:alpha-latrocrustotoxin-Lt1a-like [Nasonia vitripennis]|uniref:Uncharacterized protein n=1 Tax=Nasonia vitripennis TaxID=7425 RepID=A0A7M7Q7T1_NASVI|nr:alpha-latrocrustotoxin-Lt1a-like [Nasonia vitripennis]
MTTHLVGREGPDFKSVRSRAAEDSQHSDGGVRRCSCSEEVKRACDAKKDASASDERFSHLEGFKRLNRSRKSYRTELLFKAVKCRKISLIQGLLERGVRINALKKQSYENFYTLLMVNAINGDSEITRMLIRAGCRLNTTSLGDCTALHLAIELHNRGIAAELIASGADTNIKTARGCTALHLAVVGSTNIDRYLKETETYMRKCPYNLFNDLPDAKKFQSSIVQARISRTIQQLYAGGQERRVCLYIVNMLLNAGADVNSKDNNGCAPIHYAACTGSPELMKILIEAGADVDSQNNVGATALHIAVLFCDEMMVNILLSSGASVAAKTQKEGNTALHWAVTLNNDFNRHANIVRNLLDFGSDVNQRNALNETIIAVALGDVTQSLVLEHVAEMEARENRTMFDKHSQLDMNWRNIHNHYEELLIQLAAMNKNKIGNTLITYFFVLTESLEVVNLLANNKDFIEEFEASDYRTRYPNYAERLRKKVEAAKRIERSVKWPCEVDISSNI